MTRFNSLVSFSLIIIFSFSACKSTGQFNFFSIQQDLQLGRQVSEEIESNPKQFPILSERGNEEVYRYIRDITNQIINTGKVAHRNEFAWEVKIINDDKTLNAFATPGGFIYVYTGLIKYLDSEDQLAGVMGHEIAHAAQRHSTRQLTKLYGLQILLAVATGRANPGLMEQIALSLVSLKFSRNHESEADKFSVIYLCETDYNAAGAAGFFEKMEGSSTPPQFLSTHPNSGNRVEKIKTEANNMNCSGSKTSAQRYNHIKKLLK